MLQSYTKIQILHLDYGYDKNPDSSMSLNAAWKQAADLEVIIIDGAYGHVESPEHPSVLDFKDLLRLRWLDFSNPAPKLKRLELVYICILPIICPTLPPTCRPELTGSVPYQWQSWLG
jgi:hypothetical protein